MKIKISFIILLLLASSCLKDEELKITKNSIPKELNDDWIISTPENEGINEFMLKDAVDYFFSSSKLNNSKGLLIAKNGKLVLEAYCKDEEDRNRKHNVKSVTKSITSVVTGIAIKEGVIDTNLERTVYSYIPTFFDEDLRKREITMINCLTMATGLDDPFYSVSPVLPNNSVRTCLNVELVNPVGSKHVYNNGSANIIGGVIDEMSPLSFEQFTKKKLFDVLEITDYHWVKHSDGRVNPAFDLYLLPRDVLKFGQFCLQNGEWNGKNVLPQDWMRVSTSYYADGFDGKFGFHWWIAEKHNGYYANGHGGQRVWIIPDKDLVIVHLAEPSTDQTNLDEIPILLDKIMLAM